MAYRLENYDWGYSRLGISNASTSGVRTPLILSDMIKDTIKDKVFCDCGASEGDLAVCCKRYASKVIAIDFDEDKAEICKMKGIEGIYGNLLTMDLPDADVYYIWIGRNSLQVYEKIPSGKTVIFGNQIGEVKEAIEKLPNIVSNSFQYIRDTIPMTFHWYIIKKP